MYILKPLSVLLVIVSFALPAQSQSSWPAKPIRLLISNSAGSAPDLVARVTTDQLGKALGQSWIIENRPGGEGVIGAEAAAKSAPDGYTFYVASIVAVAVSPHLVKNIPYDALRDFTPVAMIVDSGPSAIAVHPEMPVKTFPELVTLAKNQPGKLSYSITVAFLNISQEWLNKVAGISMTQINYKDTGQAVQDALSGRVPVMVNSIGTALPHIRAGKMRFLAVTSLKRLPMFPEVPAVAEFYPGYESEGWLSLAAPVATPVEVVNRVNREMERIVRDAQFTQAVQKFVWANNSGASTPQALTAFYRAERDKWGKIIRELGIQPLGIQPLGIQPN
ncbi:MAG: Bug family tripartite tricarboxylate transporter substrate binding protein [Burkholderiales bacterium]